MIVEELYALLGFKVEGEENAKRFNQELDRLNGVAQKAAKGIGVLGVAVGTFVGTLATQLVLGFGRALTALPGQVMEVGAEFENLKVQLTALEGSSGAAEKAMAWIKDFARDTPLSLQEVTKAYASLRNFGLDPTNGTMQALTDTMAMAGGNAQNLEGIVLAVGQAWSKEKLQGEEALQLIERGVPVWQLLGDAMGKTAAQIQEMASKGKLGRKEIQLLVDQMGKRAAGASAKMSKTWSGITGRIQEWRDALMGKVANSGFFDWAKTQAESFEATLNRMDQDGTLDTISKGISGALIQAGEALKAMFADVKAEDITGFVTSIIKFGVSLIQMGKSLFLAGRWIAETIATVLGMGDAWKGLMVMIALLGAVFAPIFTAIAAVVLLVDDFTAWLAGRPSLIGWLLDKIEAVFKRFDIDLDLDPKRVAHALKKFMGPLNGAALQMGAVAAGIALAVRKLLRPLGGLSKGFSKIPIFRIFLVGAAVSTLYDAFGDVKTLDDFKNAVAGLSVIDWTVIAGGAISLVGPLTKLSAAIGGVVAQLGLLKLLTSLGGLLTLSAGIGAAALIDSGPADPSLVDPRRAPEKGNAYRNRQRYNNSFEGGMHRAGAERDMPAVEQKTEAKPFSLRQVFQDLWAPIPSQRGAGETKAESAVPAKVGDLLQSIASVASKIDTVTGSRSTEKVVETVSNDNRVDARTFNAPVSIKATITNGTPEQIGAAAGRAVRHSMGDPAVRALAITANPGGIGR